MFAKSILVSVAAIVIATPIGGCFNCHGADSLRADARILYSE